MKHGVISFQWMHGIFYLRGLGNSTKKVIHDGGKNTYTLWKDGTIVVLFPLKYEGKVEHMLLEKRLLKK